MSSYAQLQTDLFGSPRAWLVTGVAGFIGSHLLETLLKLGQRVTGLDNFATGSRRNLEQVSQLVPPEDWARFTMIEDDIRYPAACRRAVQGVDFVLHQAALGSVPHSLDQPVHCNENNVAGFLNVLQAARAAGVSRFVYASSCAVYGDQTSLPAREDLVGRPLSPYAASKRINEIYADVFARCYGFPAIGLRYFNIFGPRQDPNGAYAAVIPKWIAAMIRSQPVHIHGDGQTSRDFCYVANVVQANLLAALVSRTEALNQVYNIGLHTRTDLNQLYEMLRSRLEPHHPALKERRPVYDDFRPGDVRHSSADITQAAGLLGYAPTHSVEQGLDEALPWYLGDLRETPAP